MFTDLLRFVLFSYSTNCSISEYLICVALKEIRSQVTHQRLSADVDAVVEKAVNAQVDGAVYVG